MQIELKNMHNTGKKRLRSMEKARGNLLKRAMADAELKDITDFSVDIIPYEDANELVRNTVIEEGKLL